MANTIDRKTGAVPVFGQNRAKMAYFQTQGRGGQTHSNLKMNIFFWFPTENYNRNHPLILKKLYMNRFG